MTSPKFTQQHLRSPGPPWRVGALDLMRDPVELLQRCCLRETLRVAEGGGRRRRGVLVCIGLLCCFAGAASWESSTSHRNDGGLVCFISSLVSLTLCSIISTPPPPPPLLLLLHQIPFRALIMTFNNTEACGTSSVNTITL